MSDGQPVAVIAGSFKQFVMWCREQHVDPQYGPAFYATVSALQHLPARSGVTVVRYGTWQDRSDLSQVEDELSRVSPPPGITVTRHEPLTWYEHEDFHHVGECPCGARPRFLTRELAEEWRDNHPADRTNT